MLITMKDNLLKWKMTGDFNTLFTKLTEFEGVIKEPESLEILFDAMIQAGMNRDALTSLSAVYRQFGFRSILMDSYIIFQSGCTELLLNQFLGTESPDQSNCTRWHLSAIEAFLKYDKLSVSERDLAVSKCRRIIETEDRELCCNAWAVVNAAELDRKVNSVDTILEFNDLSMNSAHVLVRSAFEFGSDEQARAVIKKGRLLYPKSQLILLAAKAAESSRFGDTGYGGAEFAELYRYLAVKREYNVAFDLNALQRLVFYWKFNKPRTLLTRKILSMYNPSLSDLKWRSNVQIGEGGAVKFQ